MHSGNNIGLPFSNQHRIVRLSPSEMSDEEREKYHRTMECQAIIANWFFALGIPDSLRLREAL